MNNIVFKRVSAYFIDVLIIYVFIGFATGIKFLNPKYDKYVSTYNAYVQNMDKFYKEEINVNEYAKLSRESIYKLNKYGISNNIIIIVVIILYYGVFQKYNNGQTLGKKLLKIRLTSEEGKLSLMKMCLKYTIMHFAFVGCSIVLLANSILVLFANSGLFSNLTIIITYLLFIINIVSFIFMRIRKDNRSLFDIIFKMNLV